MIIQEPSAPEKPTSNIAKGNRIPSSPQKKGITIITSHFAIITIYPRKQKTGPFTLKEIDDIAVEKAGGESIIFIIINIIILLLILSRSRCCCP